MFKLALYRGLALMLLAASVYAADAGGGVTELVAGQTYVLDSDVSFFRNEPTEESLKQKLPPDKLTQFLQVRIAMLTDDAEHKLGDAKKLDALLSLETLKSGSKIHILSTKNSDVITQCQFYAFETAEGAKGWIPVLDPVWKPKFKKQDTAAAATEKEKGKGSDKDKNEGDAIVEMRDTGLKVEGKIHRETPDYIMLTLRNDEGKIRIARSNIKNIEYDDKAQLKALKEDDYAGRYKVGVWDMDKGLFDDAIGIFETLKGHEGVGPDMLKLLAQAYEKQKILDKAFENYKDYLTVHPDDTVVAERVEAIRKIVHPEDLTALDPKAAPGSPAEKKIVNGLEADGAWVFEQWGNPGTAQFTVDASGKKMIVVQAAGGPHDKAAFTRTGQPLNLSDSKEITFRIFHDSPTPILMAVAFKNAKNELHESPQMRIAAGSWNNKSVKIDGKVFKAQRNEWKDYNLELDGKENIKQISFMVYATGKFTLYIDRIFFTTLDDPRTIQK